MDLEQLPRETLVKLVQMYAKSWLAHDGCWFLAAEERFGHETAVELDARAWACFAPIEARRIQETFALPEGGGLPALAQALEYRLYSSINPQAMEWAGADRLRFRMIGCRVQEARQRKGLAPFACKPVGLVEFSGFASAIDPRIQTTCCHAPPDPVEDSYCEWEFKLPG